MKFWIFLFFVIIISSCRQTDQDDTKRAEISFNNSELWDEWRLRTEDGISLFVREFGVGDTILVLHGGWGAEHSYLIKAFAPLGDKYHFIFYDQRGSLRSQCPDTLISIDKHIADLESLRISTGQQKLLLIGHSMGGFLGMSYLQKYPERVKGLIAISSVPAIGNIKQLTEDLNASALQRWERKEVIDTLEAHGLDIQARGNYDGKRKGLTHRITFAALNMHSVKNWRKLEGAFYWNQQSATIAATSGPQKWDFTPDMMNAGCPIGIIHGDDDYLPLDYNKSWIPNVPNAELHVIKDAGHLCWIDQPEEFEQILISSLNKYQD